MSIIQSMMNHNLFLAHTVFYMGQVVAVTRSNRSLALAVIFFITFYFIYFGNSQFCRSPDVHQYVGCTDEGIVCCNMSCNLYLEWNSSDHFSFIWHCKMDYNKVKSQSLKYYSPYVYLHSFLFGKRFFNFKLKWLISPVSWI